MEGNYIGINHFCGTLTLFKAGALAEKLKKKRNYANYPTKMMNRSFAVAMVIAMATGTNIVSTPLTQEKTEQEIVLAELNALSKDR